MQANQLAIHCRQTKAHYRLTPKHWILIEHLLQEDWITKQISLWLADQGAITISHEWIFQHVLQEKSHDGTLYRHFLCQRARKKQYGAYDRHGHLCNLVFIEERPGIVEDRTPLDAWGSIPLWAKADGQSSSR